MKTGPFAEHSNTLWGISGVAEWNKVNSGLIKMLKAEVVKLGVGLNGVMVLLSFSGYGKVSCYSTLSLWNNP